MKNLNKLGSNQYRSKYKQKYWSSIAIMTIIYLIFQIGIFGYQYADSVIRVAFASEVIVPSVNLVNSKLHLQNQKLDLIAKVATAEDKPVQLKEDQVKAILSIVIPDASAQARLYTIIHNCENHSFNPIAVNENIKDGKVWSYDLGVAQINNYYHSKQVQALFGEDFDKAMKDPAKNLMFAAWMWQHDKNFHAWSCDKKV